MKHPFLFLIILLTGALVSIQHAAAQQRHGSADTILMGAVVEGVDTFAVFYLPEFEKVDALPRRLAKKRQEWNRLKANVYKVYPYAVTAGELLKGVDERLAQLEDDRSARKAYLKGLERQLNQRFKGELSNLTITQGQILVKLINRQTGRPCFGIIKELKGGFSAVVFQSIALLFNNSLKREYDPTGRDSDIEAIVRELEVGNYYKYQQQTQGRRAGT